MNDNHQLKLIQSDFQLQLDPANSNSAILNSLHFEQFFIYPTSKIRGIQLYVYNAQ